MSLSALWFSQLERPCHHKDWIGTVHSFVCVGLQTDIGILVSYEGQRNIYHVKDATDGALRCHVLEGLDARGFTDSDTAILNIHDQIFQVD